MNYYKRHLGDYARDTGHLSVLEHGIYTLLLDWYYANERPIPADKTERISRGNPKETQTVLSEFFKLTENGWIHSYADRVIADYNAKADRNRQAGKLGGRPRKTQTVSKTNPQETLATSHKPLAINHKQEKEADLLVGLPEQLARDFLKIRKAKKQPLTQTALDAIKREAGKAGLTFEQAITTCCENGWAGFKQSWQGVSAPAQAQSGSPASRRALT